MAKYFTSLFHHFKLTFLLHVTPERRGTGRESDIPKYNQFIHDYLYVVFQGWSFGTGQPSGFFFPREDHFSHKLSLVAYSLVLGWRLMGFSHPPYCVRWVACSSLRWVELMGFPIHCAVPTGLSAALCVVLRTFPTLCGFSVGVVLV